VAAVGLAVALALAGCGDDDGGDDGGSTATTSTSAGPSTTGPSTTGAPTTTSGTATPTTAPDGELPGTPVDLPPRAGASLAVVGVAADDVLNVRLGPGTTFDVVTTLAPLAEGIVAAGENRQLDSGAVWARVEADGTDGWANSAFLLQRGTTTDETASHYPTPADRPLAADLVALGEEVAGEFASTEPRSRVTVVDGPQEGDVGEVTLDVLGIGDDSVGGYRLHVFAEPDAGGFRLRSLEVTVLCSRGADDQGRCA